jgi:DNA-binding MarR family transcriptional regulator
MFIKNYHSIESEADMTEEVIRKLLNQILKDLFFKILKLQAKMVSRAAQENISRTEMHTLEAIEGSEYVTLTQIADKLCITKATASVTVKRLVKKGFVKKVKEENDKRISTLKLTAKGEESCSKHREFHEGLVDGILHEFNIAEHPHVVKSLQALLDYFIKLEKSFE